MTWLGYGLGIIVGTVFGFWFHHFWEKDLTGIGSPQPPSFDLIVPVILFAVVTGVLIALARRR